MYYGTNNGLILPLITHCTDWLNSVTDHLHLSLSWQIYWSASNMSLVLLWQNVQFTFCIHF